MDKRIVRTSAGFVGIVYSGSGWGDVEVFDADGWRVDQGVWGMRGYSETLADVLRERTSLADDEVTRVAAETADQYRRRGGDPEQRIKLLPSGARKLAGGLAAAVICVLALGLAIGSLLL